MDASAQTVISYRWATAEDYEILGEIMFAAIHAEPSPYTPAQRLAWCPKPPSGADWMAKLASQQVAVVEIDQKLVGMMTLEETGYLDLAFLLPQARGQGHLAKLFEMIKDRVRDYKLDKITTHASLAAQSPFTALGFHTLHRESVQRNGETLQRAEMRLELKNTGRDASIR
ncbi:GNAT family N-acetyltransferase [uncultured Pelagimonas sp.]|uniref:GNAT family N-acetyltransferase n=1 Tax=uncultured Pelagimonas sp. TaxID=1618102 RepID=UPI002615523C|nr:GNAT family N-acetyltransferase [uncultured Pelagimonas sp.]